MLNPVLRDMSDEALLRAYAQGKISWGTLRQREAFEWYGDVLFALGEFGLEVPTLKDEEMTDEYRQGIEDLRRSIQTRCSLNP